MVLVMFNMICVIVCYIQLVCVSLLSWSNQDYRKVVYGLWHCVWSGTFVLQCFMFDHCHRRPLACRPFGSVLVCLWVLLESSLFLSSRHNSPWPYQKEFKVRKRTREHTLCVRESKDMFSIEQFVFLSYVFRLFAFPLRLPGVCVSVAFPSLTVVFLSPQRVVSIYVPRRVCLDLICDLGGLIN